MISVDEALRHILDRVRPLEPVSCGLLDALGHTLAEDIFAVEPISPFDNSAMDGYALIASDTLGATREHPIRLSVLEDLPAGKVAQHSVAPGSAIRIMTGAPIPGGADAVMMVEDTASGEGWVDIHATVGPGANIRRAGEDVKPGERVLRQGMTVGPAEVGMLAGMGLTVAPVIRRPRVAVFSTGDEVVAPGEPLGPGKIRNSNLYALSAQVKQCGAQIFTSQHIPDDLDTLEQAITGCSGADVIITAGGVSVGDYDLVKDALARLGEMHFWRVAMKPGKPLVFGEIAGRFFFGLPGNPVSAMVTFEEFARPALRKMAGFASWALPEVEAVLEHDLKRSTGRPEFIRARTRLENSQYITASTGPQGSHQLRSMLGANSFIIAPADRGLLPAGSRVRVQLLEGGLS